MTNFVKNLVMINKKVSCSISDKPKKKKKKKQTMVLRFYLYLNSSIRMLNFKKLCFVNQANILIVSINP